LPIANVVGALIDLLQDGELLQVVVEVAQVGFLGHLHPALVAGRDLARAGFEELLEILESGANGMSATRLHQFAQLLGVPVTYYFDGWGEAPAADAGGPGPESMSDRELLELMKAFRRIKRQDLRRRPADLTRAIAEAGGRARGGAALTARLY
jgi:hypothetical protein